MRSGLDSVPKCDRTALLSQVVAVSSKELKGRIESVSNTQKITDAMKLVAAAKVRRAQDAVINGRPFAENLVKACAMPERRRYSQHAHMPAHTHS